MLYGLTLDEAIEQTLKNSPDLKQVSTSIQSAQKEVKLQKASNFGSFDLSASYTHYNIARTLTPITPSTLAPGSSVATTQDLMSIGLSYNVVLFSGFAQTHAIEIASVSKKMAQARHLLTKNQLIFNVKSIYINILALQAQYEAQQSYVAALESLHKDVALKVELGNASKIDELKSLADLSRAKSQLTNFQTSIKILKESLATLMMVQKVDNLQPINITVDTAPLKDTTYAASLEKTTKMKLASLEVLQKEEIAKKMNSTLYPTLMLQAYVGENGGVNDSSNPNSGDFEYDDLWQVGVVAKWNIFDFGKKNAQIQKSKISLLASQLAKQKTQRELQRSLVEALSKIKLATQNYQSALNELNLMSQTQKIEKVRYDNGASDINDLLYTQARYQMAQSGFIAAKYNYQNALNYLNYILEREK